LIRSYNFSGVRVPSGFPWAGAQNTTPDARECKNGKGKGKARQRADFGQADNAVRG
jgi:hypothetical protein